MAEGKAIELIADPVLESILAGEFRGSVLIDSRNGDVYAHDEETRVLLTSFWSMSPAQLLAEVFRRLGVDDVFVS